MTTTYTKIAKSEIYNDNTMSIGFRRLLCLPKRIRKSFDIAMMIKNNLSLNNHEESKMFFEKMTEKEYCEYVINH
jgi:hypothetical protein